jgi:hypothetical protein
MQMQVMTVSYKSFVDKMNSCDDPSTSIISWHIAIFVAYSRIGSYNYWSQIYGLVTVSARNALNQVLLLSIIPSRHVCWDLIADTA